MLKKLVIPVFIFTVAAIGGCGSDTPSTTGKQLRNLNPRGEETPRPIAITSSAERAAGPLALGLALTRGLHRLGDQRLREPSGDEVRLDAKTARAAQ